MRKIYIVLFVLFVIILGVIFFMKPGQLKAPTTSNSNITINQNQVPGDMQNTGGGQPVNTVTNTATEPTVDNMGVKEFTISAQNFSFLPSVMNVKKGDKVRIIFKNTFGFHDFKIDGLNIATKQTKAPYQEILEFTASKTGNFEYYCSVGSHRAMGMWGTLNVE